MIREDETTSTFPGLPPVPHDIRALLLDDSTFDRARIRRLSRKTELCVHLDEVDSIAALDVAVATQNYDLILIDYRLPVGDGMEALDHVLKNDRNKDAGKIMITGDGARQTAMAAMRGGYHDCLTKEEMDAEGLRDAMVSAVTMAREQRQLMMQATHHRELLRQGLVDALQDSEVQGSVLSLVHRNMHKAAGRYGDVSDRFAAADIDALLASMDDEDDFVFH